MSRNLWHRFTSRGSGSPTKRRAAARSRSSRPALEALEDRTLLSAGALDLTFGGSGTVITHAGTATPSFEGARAVAIDHQGNIVVAGTSKIGIDYDFTVFRYHPDGTLDTTFGSNGKRTIDVDASGHDDGAYAVAIDSQGRIVLAGYSNNGTEDDFAVVRLNANGFLDGSFNGTGIVVTAVGHPGPANSAAYAVAIDAQGRIYAAGYAKVGIDDDFAVVRYNTDGSLDTTFAGNGKRTVDMDGAGFTDHAYGVAIDSQGRIVLVGQVYNGTDSDFGIARLTTTGALDGTFNGSGRIIYHAGSASPSYDAAHAVAIDLQGRIVVAGTSKIGIDYDFTVLRFTADGNPDSTFGNAGKRTIDVDGAGHDDGAYGVAIDGHGRIVLAGYASNGSVTSFAFARLLSNGTTDFSFGNAGKFMTNASSTGGNSQAYGVAVDATGRVVAAGFAANAVDADFATVRLTGSAADNTGDFNHDGNVDLVWRQSSTGQVWMWGMNGTTWTSAVLIGVTPAGNDWQIVGKGDFNNDGNVDILWRQSSTGQVWTWNMNGTTWVGATLIGTSPAGNDWQIVGTGDFKKNGNVDLLWRQSSTGQVWTWNMNGTTWVGATLLGGSLAGNDWQIVGTGDFNKDGNVDILWRQSSTGQVWTWTMSGTTWVGAALIGVTPAGNDWQIRDVGDFDHSGYQDLVWRQSSTGQVWMWGMNGTTWKSAVLLGGSPAGDDWQIF
jgi:uncharacterized delta-60 repeat protein